MYSRKICNHYTILQIHFVKQKKKQCLSLNNHILVPLLYKSRTCVKVFYCICNFSIHTFLSEDILFIQKYSTKAKIFTLVKNLLQ